MHIDTHVYIVFFLHKFILPCHFLGASKVASNNLLFPEFKLILSDHLSINHPEKYKDWFNEFSHGPTGTMTLTTLQEFFQAFVSAQSEPKLLSSFRCLNRSNDFENWTWLSNNKKYITSDFRCNLYALLFSDVRFLVPSKCDIEWLQLR